MKKRDWVEVKLRIGNISLRKAAGVNAQSALAEIVAHQQFDGRDSVYVLAFVQPNREGTPDIRFVGDRPLKPEVNWDDFGALCRLAIELFSGADEDY
jgi:hypothetical protein